MLSNRTFCNDENVLWLYCPNMVATGHKYLLSTWNVAVQLSNWILLFRFNSFSLKRSHVAAPGKKPFYSLSQAPPAPDGEKLDSELSSEKWAWFCLRKQVSLLSHSSQPRPVFTKGSSPCSVSRIRTSGPSARSFGDLNSGSLLRFL